MLTEIPNGLDEIIHVFGSLDDPHFEENNITMFSFPYPLLYAGKPVSKGRCHRLVVDNFVAVFKELHDLELAHMVQEADYEDYAGIYNQRPIRGQSSHPSTHSWGIAIDLEPGKYPLGSAARFPDVIINVFKKYGFFYGGDFKSRKDPMHFQLATGY